MLLYHTLRQLSTEDADCCRFALPHRRPSGLIFLRHRFTDPTLPRGSILPRRGRGAKRKAKGRVGGRQERQAPAAFAIPAPGERTISNAEVPLPRSPLSLAAGTAPPVNKQKPLVVQVPPGFSPRGCKGRSPLHEITLILPLPAGKGVGGMGAGNKAKGRVCRRQGRHAPAGHHSDKVYKCRRRFSAGVPGAVAPGEINFGSPPSRREGGRGDGGKNVS